MRRAAVYAGTLAVLAVLALGATAHAQTCNRRIDPTNCDYTCTCGPSSCGNCGIGGDPGMVDCCVPAAQATDSCAYADGFCPGCASGFLTHGWSCVPNRPAPTVSGRNTIVTGAGLLLLGLWSVRRVARRRRDTAA